jgi:hypothetical protein
MLFMGVLLAFAGMVIDIGHAYMAKRHLQASVDMAALSGAQKLDATSSGAAAADAEAVSLVKLNYDPLPEPDVSAAACPSDATSVCIRGTSDIATTLLAVVGVDRLDLGAEAEARITTYNGFSNVAPWGLETSEVTESSYKPGTPLAVRGDNNGNSPKNRGTLLIKVGSGCSLMKSNQERETVGLELGVCQIKVGDKIAADPGQSATEPKAGLTRRGIVNPCTAACLDTFTKLDSKTGRRYVTNLSAKNLLMLPLITPWTKGGGSVTVVGFIWFAVTKNDGALVEGIVVDPPGAVSAGMTCNTTACSTGPFTAGSQGGKLIKLTR